MRRPAAVSKATKAPVSVTLLFHLTHETITTDVRPRHQIADRESMPIWYAPVAIPKRANTYLAGSRTYPSTSPTGDTRCRAQSVHQSHCMQSQGPLSCPTSQLRYWQPKGLPAPPITPAPRLGRTPTSTMPSQDALLSDAG